MTSRQRDLFGRLADAGEEAIQRLGSAPGGERLVGAVNGLRERVDEIQKRLRGLDALEQRMADLERRLEAVESKGTTSSSAGSRSRSSSGSTGTKKSSSSSSG